MAHDVPWRIERNTACWPFYGCMYHAILFASARYRLYLLRNKVDSPDQMILGICHKERTPSKGHSQWAIELGLFKCSIGIIGFPSAEEVLYLSSLVCFDQMGDRLSISY